MVLLKSVMPVVEAETVSVMIAAEDCPAVRVEACLSQLTVRYVFAPAGDQALVAKLRVMVPVPVFLT
jgi:hypothetical protein